ncbi:hypothetical protein Tco_1044992, partial [Tanacetum coccineum]
RPCLVGLSRELVNARVSNMFSLFACRQELKIEMYASDRSEME